MIKGISNIILPKIIIKPKITSKSKEETPVTKPREYHSYIKIEPTINGMIINKGAKKSSVRIILDMFFSFFRYSMFLFILYHQGILLGTIISPGNVKPK